MFRSLRPFRVLDFYKLLRRRRAALRTDGAVQPYPALSALVEHFGGSRRAPDVLYLGDSVVERIAREDSDRRTLGEMVEASLRSHDLHTLVISHSAYNSCIYYHLCTVLQKLASLPRLVMIPINIRSFSPQWDLNPAWQFEQEIQIIAKYRNNPGNGIGVLYEYQPSQEKYERFDNTPVLYPISHLRYIGQFRLFVQAKPETEAQRRLRQEQLFIFHYMYFLDGESDKVQFLDKLVYLLMRLGIFSFIYFTPINYQAGLRYVGPPFMRQVKDNIAVITRKLRSYVTSGHAIYLDYTTLLESDYFFHRDLATEHLNERGRLELSRRLSEHIIQYAERT